MSCFQCNITDMKQGCFVFSNYLIGRLFHIIGLNSLADQGVSPFDIFYYAAWGC